MTKPTIDLAIFDIDGTLLDSMPDLLASTNRALADLGYPTLTPEQFRSYMGNGFRQMIDLILPNQDAAARHTFILHWEEVRHDMDNRLTGPFPGIPELLDGLRARGVALAVFTNRMAERSQAAIDAHFPGVFDRIQGTDPENGWPHKPAPDGLLRLMAEMGADPARTVFIGDNTVDIQAAKGAGCISAAALWGYTDASDLMAENPDVSFASADDAARYFC